MKKPTKKMTTLVAVGSGLATLPANALELGEANVSSTLGQPLKASIAYALAPSEEILQSCVSVGGGIPNNGLPAVGSTSISIANGVISITGRSPIREPLVAMRVNIRCPYAANITRDYMLFVDPPQSAPVTANSAPVSQNQPVRQSAPAAARPSAAPAPTPRRTVAAAPAAPIQNATRYQVPFGTSLSEIAQRIENRPVGLWQAVDQIFKANPHAFIDNDMNQLKAGVWIDIPDFGAGAPVTISDTALSTTSATEGVSTSAPTVVDNTADSVAYDTAGLDLTTDNTAEVTPSSETETTAPADATVADTDVLQPAAITDFSEPEVVIPDTELEGPETTSESPNGTVATAQTPAVEAESTNWLAWLGGAGAALILLLLFFGRLVRNRFGESPIAAVEAPQRRRTDGDTTRVEALVVEQDDEDPTEENLALELDADLVAGTGLSAGTEVDVTEEFAFSSATEIDIELPEEMSSGGAEPSGATDIIPPLNIEAESILDEEVMADGELEDDDYDMSVIIDATKMPRPADITQNEIEAVEIEASDETLITGDYTLSSEVDYNILEQDYEDELTATQALNAEINRAAAELAERMEDSDDGDLTAEMSLASVTAIDVTANIPANDDADAEDDRTAILNTEEPTVDLNAEEKTVEMERDDDTVEMPATKNGGAA
ncbi:MAG: hypothetical protein AAF351_04985 [Pseudomonadota bacterium]